MFVHQEEWQRRLLLRYGSDLVLMDATYKTTKYAIPLFFVCVHTNVGYKVVAEFLCQNEDNECIAEALHIIKSWNPTWKPKYFMVDYSMAEINAIESEFPDVAVYICDFHREQAWQRWVKAGKNGLTVGEQKMFLELMQAIARARSETSYKKAVESLRKSTLYLGNPKVQEYCGKVWLDCSDRWAHAFRVQQAVNIVNTNNGIEAQNKLFKYRYLPGSLDKSVFGIVVMIVESFIPDSYQHYLDTNLQLSGSYREFKRDIPDYLHNRPSHFVKHCLRSNFGAAEFAEHDVKCVNLEKGEFLVKSSSNSTKLFAFKLSKPASNVKASVKRISLVNTFLLFSTSLTSGALTAFRIPTKIASSPCILIKPTQTKNQPRSRVQRGAETTVPASYSDEDDAPAQSSTSSRPKIKDNEQPLITQKLRKRLQERVDELRSETFVVDDSAILENTITTVECLLKDLRQGSSIENGLPLRQSPAKKKLKVTEVDYHKVKHETLPKRRRLDKG